MESHAMQLNGVGAPQPSGPTGHWERLQAAQNFRRVIEKDLVDYSGLQRGPIQLAARFDHQRPVLLTREPGRELSQVCPAALSIENQHSDAAVFQRATPFVG